MIHGFSFTLHSVFPASGVWSGTLAVKTFLTGDIRFVIAGEAQV